MNKTKIRRKLFTNKERKEINKLDYLFKCTKCLKIKSNLEFHKKIDKKRIRQYQSSCKKCENIRIANWSRDSIVSKKYKLKSKFNLDYDVYIQMLNKQNNSCAICKKNQIDLKKIMSVDHNHQTNKVRGILCHGCNVGIGFFEDNIEFLKQAIKYLRKSLK